MKKLYSVILALTLCVLPVSTSAETQTITVSQGGKTLTQALTEAESKLSEGNVKIVVEDGIYNEATLSVKNTSKNTLTITGTENAGITHSSVIPDNLVTKVEDTGILNKISVDAVKENLYTVNLWNVDGITQFEGVPYTVDNMTVTQQINFFVNNKPLTLARYPDGIEYLNISSSSGGNTIVNENASRWADSQNAYVFGFLQTGWSADTVKITSISGNSITLSRTLSTIENNARFYVYNALEEISQDGEYYIDTSGNMYVYMENGKQDIYYTQDTTPLMEILGQKNIKIEGVSFSENLGDGITIGNKCSNVVIDGVTVNSLSGVGITVSDSNDVTAANSHIYNMGGKGIYAIAGNREALTGSDVIISNNEIHDFGLYNKSYQAGINLTGACITASSNKIYNCPHTAITIYGNNHIIENNEIYSAVRETNDAGAIYTGRDLSSRGSIIRNNFFHDIPAVGNQTYSVYLDDFVSGVKIDNNLFYEVSSGGLIGGGSYNEFTNNLIINSATTLHADARGLDELDSFSEVFNTAVTRYTQSAYYNLPGWLKEYPELVSFNADSVKTPTANIITGNTSVASGEIYFYDEAVRTNGTVENNTALTDTVTVTSQNGKPVLSTALKLTGIDLDIIGVKEWDSDNYLREYVKNADGLYEIDLTEYADNSYMHTVTIYSADSSSDEPTDLNLVYINQQTSPVFTADLSGTGRAYVVYDGVSAQKAIVGYVQLSEPEPEEPGADFVRSDATVTMVPYNLTGSYQAFIATYSGKRLVQISKLENLTATVPTGAGYTYKAMIWDSFSGMTPLIDVQEIN